MEWLQMNLHGNAVLQLTCNKASCPCFFHNKAFCLKTFFNTCNSSDTKMFIRKK